ncbi:MAG: hypothetical protein KJ798_05370 [Gammaproteobacteria bacterium]|nr:hypothetical protein [Gammaproteobacteria bacterium]MBU0848167.1 hypothetical protein [Gammaproteobacteria bacterium]MBU1266385.1 hypothetical protein [Gammaproteobacteria bacterium]MBU1527874.1 hypothetical protein [Gammaproteobacteria bacterium]MBU1779796.1 hypothetical protein [Gammaproteobacteria bacterium]
MIEFLFSLLLVPMLPELADPAESHSTALKELDRRLSRGGPGSMEFTEGSVIDPLPGVSPTLNMLNPGSSSLPVITGGLFEWSSITPMSGQGYETAGGSSAASLRLTGLIETSGQRIAILNDGEKDHVVGVGSYVLNTHKVVTLGRRHAVLIPLDVETGGARLELNLIPGDLPRGF